MAANLVSAMLSQRRFQAAVNATQVASNSALTRADLSDAAYAVSFFALRFLEAAALESDNGEHLPFG